MELALIYNFQSLSSFFPFQSSFFSRVSFFVIFTIAKELTSISLASSVASDVHFHCRIQFSSLSHLKDGSPRNRFVDMMFFCPWHLTDVAPPLIRILFPNFAICLLYRDSLLECTLVLSRQYHYLNWRTKLLRIVSQKSQSLFRGLPCTVFPVPKNNYYTRAALFSAPEFSSGKYPWTWQFLFILSSLLLIPNKAINEEIRSFPCYSYTSTQQKNQRFRTYV